MVFLAAGCSLAPSPADGGTANSTVGAAAGASGSGRAPDLFAPTPPPSGIDPQRLRISLAEIPGDPPPPKAGPAAAPELPRQALRHLEEAERLFSQERYSETVTEAGKALRYHPDILQAHRLAALASLFLGKTAQAEKHAATAVALQPDDLACRYVQGRLAEKVNKPDEAIAAYRTALKCPVRPGCDAYLTLTHHYLGMLLYELGYYKAAVEQLLAFEAAAARAGDAPGDPELTVILQVKRAVPLLALADSQEALGDYAAAAEMLARALQVTPENQQARIRYIKNLVRARQFGKAESAAAAFADAQRDVKAAELMIAVYEAAGHRSQGMAALGQLRSKAPDNIELALFHADRLIAAKRFDEAVAVLQAVEKSNPKTDAARWKLISIHRAQGDDQAWMRAVGAQLAAKPDEKARALEELARIPVDRAGKAIAEALSGKAPASGPAEDRSAKANAGYYYCLGWLADRLNRAEDAAALYGRSLGVSPDFTLAALGTAELWINRCDWDKALDVLKNTDSDDPVLQAAVLRLQGQCYDGLDKMTEAATQYRASLKKAPAPETAMLLGRLLDRFHMAKEAAEVYRQTLNTNPEMVEIRELLVMNLLNRWSENENLKGVLAQMKEMQSTAPEHPVTTRTTALVRLLLRQPPDMDAYIRVLTSLVETRPEDVQSRRSLAVGLVRKADYAAAIAHLEKILAAVPCDAEANELLAVALMRQLSIDKAAEQLVRSLRWYPNREALLRNLAETRLVQQDYDGAIEAWQKLLSLETNKDRHRLYRARLVGTCLQAARYEKARQLAESWLEGEKNELPAIRSYLLAADAGEGNYDAYLERCGKWLADAPDDERVRQWMLGIGDLPGQAPGGLIGAGRRDEAVAQATAWAAMEAGQSDGTAGFVLLRTLRAAQRPGDVIELCRARLSIEKDTRFKLSLLQVLADAYLMADRPDEAIAAAKELGNQIAQIPQADLSVESDDLLISFMAQAKRYDDAISLANRVISTLDDQDARLAELAQNESLDVTRKVQVIQAQEQIRRQRSQLLRSMSFIYTKQERRDQTIDCLRQARKLTPEEAGINNDLGYTLADAGMNLDEAEQMLKAAVSEVLWNGVGEDEQQAAFLDSLGWLYYKQGKFDEARRWLSLGVKMQDGDDPVIHDHLGDLEWRLNHTAEAVRNWKRALELHDRNVTEANRDADEKLVKSIRDKLAEAARNGKPPVATATAD